MRYPTILCGLVAAFMCLTQNANAQYIPAQIHRDGAGFVDNHGMVLSDQDIIDLVGEDIYFETVVGARKQYSAGRNLIRSGAITAGAGLAGFMGGVVLMAASETGYDRVRQTYYDVDGIGALGATMMITGCLAATVGCLLLDAGLPLKIIGQSRLNWVENDYNERNRGYSLHVGTAPHGVGLTMTF